MIEPDFQSIFESLPDSYLIVSPDFKIVEATDTYLKAVHLERKDIVGKEIFEVFPDTSADSFQKRYIDRLREKEGRLSMLTEKARDYSIFMVDPAGNVQSWNKGAENLKGYSAVEIIGKNVSIFYTKAAIEKGDAERNLKTAKEYGSFESEGWRVRKDGSKFWADVIITSLYTEEGKFKGYSKITRDLTERKNAEEKLQNANQALALQNVVIEKRAAELVIANTELAFQNVEKEKRAVELTDVNNELEAFSYSVSHDLRAPLRAINGYAKMLEEDYGNILNEDGKRKIEVIMGNAKKMGTLIDDLLTFSRIGRKPVQKSDINMKTLAENVLLEINKTIQYKTTVILNELHPAYGDYSLIYQVVMNLLLNSLKYSSKVEKPVVEITSEEKDGEVIYTIKDNGAGFDMRYVDKLFNVFQRLHTTVEFEGTGVGLAIVQRIINKHGGKVWAEGKVNEGAEFHFSLPEKTTENAK